MARSKRTIRKAPSTTSTTAAGATTGGGATSGTMKQSTLQHWTHRSTSIDGGGSAAPPPAAAAVEEVQGAQGALGGQSGGEFYMSACLLFYFCGEHYRHPREEIEGRACHVYYLYKMTWVHTTQVYSCHFNIFNTVYTLSLPIIGWCTPRHLSLEMNYIYLIYHVILTHPPSPPFIILLYQLPPSSLSIYHTPLFPPLFFKFYATIFQP
jgi:hypothetical protein